MSNEQYYRDRDEKGKLTLSLCESGADNPPVSSPLGPLRQNQSPLAQERHDGFVWFGLGVETKIV